MIGKAEDHLYIFEEYLALEEEAEYKSEYRRGQIVALAGASANHNNAPPTLLNLAQTPIKKYNKR